jgi:HEAT repeat protein
MWQHDNARLPLAAAATMLASVTAMAADDDDADKEAAAKTVAEPKVEVDPVTALNNAFEALKTYDWGQEVALVKPISDAVVATYGDAAARKDLETRLMAVLTTAAPRDAKDFVCRQLRVIGTARSVPTLAGLLSDADLSHMARYALERMPAPEAAKALRDALAKLSGVLQIGMISSLGARRDTASVPALIALLKSDDAKIVAAAACALGDIGNAEAGKALVGLVKKAPEGSTSAVIDACLVCAERLLADGKKTEAMPLYKALSGEDQPKHVRAAATRGMLMTAGKKN